jgi:hypothetical protein
MERTVLITGGDKAYFLMGCMLVHSLKTHAPRLPVYFLDFGLDRAQRIFLSGLCTVVRRPDRLDPAMHHYASKAAMGEFMRGVPWSNLIWLDSDMIAIGAVGASLKGLLRQLGDSDVGACTDAIGSIGEFIAKNPTVTPFIEALAPTGIAADEPYLNVGFVVCRSQAFLDAWHKRTAAIAPHLCFEQNTFNITVRERGRWTLLDAQAWNMHGRMLRDNAAGIGSGLILHATSDRADEDLTNNEWVAFGPQRIASSLKLFRNPQLRAYQEAVLMDFMRGSHAELQHLGILV